jgi:hypothetical protein
MILTLEILFLKMFLFSLEVAIDDPSSKTRSRRTFTASSVGCAKFGRCRHLSSPPRFPNAGRSTEGSGDLIAKLVTIILLWKEWVFA